MILFFNGQLLSQITWEVDLTASNTAPIRDCTPITLNFSLIQAWSQNEPMTGITLELMLLDDAFQVVENAAGFTLTTPPNPNYTSGGLSYDIWQLNGVEIPSTDDGATANFQITVVQTGDIDDPEPSIFYRATYGANVIGVSPGPTLISDLTFLEIGTTPASVTLLSDVDQDIQQNGDILIRGTLTADVNFDFNNNKTVYMDENALIQVKNGIELKFTTQTIVQGCAAAWTGIEVLTGGKLVVDGSTDQSPNKVVIQGAENAVIARDGSEIFVKEAIFRNNGVGIFVPETDDGANQIDLVARSVLFEGNDEFPGETALAGIQVNQMAIPLQSSENTFRNLVWGINGFRSHIISDQDYFENCSSYGIAAAGPDRTLVQTGRGLNEANPTFLDCYAGIFVQNMNRVQQQCHAAGRYGV